MKTSGKTNSQASNSKKKTNDFWCTHCQKSRHMVEGCFELTGYSEWWNPKGTKTQNKVKSTSRAAATTADETQTTSITKEDYNKLIKLLRAIQVKDNARATANMIGKTSSFVEPWIIDSGASDHVTHHGGWLNDMKKVLIAPL